MQEEVITRSDQILLKENQLSTQQMRKEAEIGLQKIINDIPSKTIKGYKNTPTPPWFNKERKDLFKKHNAAYRKWMRTKSHQDEQAFQDLKSEAQRMWNQAKKHYTEGIFTPEEEDYERPRSQPLTKFWGYIKSLKKDTSEVSPREGWCLGIGLKRKG